MDADDLVVAAGVASLAISAGQAAKKAERRGVGSLSAWDIAGVAMSGILLALSLRDRRAARARRLAGSQGSGLAR